MESVAEYRVRLRVYAVVDDGQRFTSNQSGTVIIDRHFIYINWAESQDDHQAILLDGGRQVAEKIAFPAEQDSRLLGDFLSKIIAKKKLFFD